MTHSMLSRADGDLNRPDSLGMRCRSYKLRMTQTITQISTMVPISPYPNIVASTENKILEFRILMRHFASFVSTTDVQFGTQSDQFLEGREAARVFPQSSRQSRPINRECEFGESVQKCTDARNDSFYNARINGQRQAEGASSEDYR
jgi:hypothetical protein